MGGDWCGCGCGCGCELGICWGGWYFILGAGAKDVGMVLWSEWVGGCARCKRMKKVSSRLIFFKYFSGKTLTGQRGGGVRKGVPFL